MALTTGRAELTKQRTAKANQIRGTVVECGWVAPKEIVHLRRALPYWLKDAENDLGDRSRRLLNGLWGDLRALDDCSPNGQLPQAQGRGDRGSLQESIRLMPAVPDCTGHKHSFTALLQNSYRKETDHADL